ncbi:MAG TPA: type VI secretion system protein TssA [Nitrospiria bacterium]|nr:type VI secretion system protein TssA [Nitrospiria bacterium]
MEEIVTKEVEQWSAIGGKPIRADAPAGDSARYDPAYEKIQAEIAKMDGLSGAAISWKDTVSLAREILEGKSKDLLVASYLCLGLFEEKGYPGLLAGLVCIEGMVGAFWETLYPEAKRMRGRINAIYWLAEKGGAAVERKGPSPREGEVIRACAGKIEAVEKLLDERLGSDSPGLGDLRRAVDQRLREAESEEARTAPASQSTTAEAAPSQETTTAVPSISTEIGSREDADKVLEGAVDLLRKAAAYVRGAEPEAPWTYRMVRDLTWASLEAAPPSDGGETRVPPPPAHLAEQFQMLSEKASWKELLEHAESLVQEFPFWLDPHRQSALALTRLGPDFAAAKDAVCTEVRTLVQRLPALLECKFSDGTPFAAIETRNWIEREVGLSGNGASPSAPASAEGDRVAEARQKSDQLLAGGKVKEAIALYHGMIAEAPASRDRFVLRLEFAKLAMQSGYPRLALPQLDALDREIDHYALEEWDPPLTLEVLRVYWSVLKRLKEEAQEGTPEWDRKAEAVRARITRLDPMLALELEGK